MELEPGLRPGVVPRDDNLCRRNLPQTLRSLLFRSYRPAMWLLGLSACSGSSGPRGEADEGDEDVARVDAETRTDTPDPLPDDAESSPDIPPPPDDGSSEDGDAVPEDAGDADAEEAWELVDESCVDYGLFPPGTVACTPSYPVCPVGISYCCQTTQCGSLEFGVSGCCTDLSCGSGSPSEYHCTEAMGESVRRLCTRPEEEFRCPAEMPYCCWLRGGPAVCADHALVGYSWTCENQW